MQTASILTFHDSVELFLHLSSEELQAEPIKRDFLEYWDKLKGRQPDNNNLGFHSQMKKLNNLRVGLKHHGVPPPESEIVASRVNVTNFFEKYTLIIFKVDFDKISMIDSVQNTSAREYLTQATTFMEQGRYGEALYKIAIAFDKIIVNYEGSKQSGFGKSVFHFGMRDPHSVHFNVDNDIIKYVNKSIEPLQKAVKILGLGLDLRRYVKFSLLTPEVFRTYGGVYLEFAFEPPSGRTKEHCQFCYDFVIDSAIRIQEFDFDTEKL